jgi:hypothetical protein
VSGTPGFAEIARIAVAAFGSKIGSKVLLTLRTAKT